MTAGLITVAGALLFVAGVGVRWLSFVLYRAAWALLPYAPNQPPPDTAFLGARTLVTPYLVLFLLLLAGTLWMTRGHGAWHQAFTQGMAAGGDLERLQHRFETELSEAWRAILDPATSASRIDRLKSRVEATYQEIDTGLKKLDDSRTIMDSFHLPSEGRSYPIRAFGIAFESRRIFLLFMAGVVACVLSLVVVPFPSTVVLQVSLYAGFGMMVYGAFGKGERSIPWLALSVVVVALGATFAGAMTYRVPVGDFTWSEGAGFEPGRYAIIGTSDTATYLLRCGDPLGEVVAVHVAPDVVVLEPVVDTAREPALFEVIVEGRALTFEGPTSGCQ